jgi:hypothetical protein
LVHRFPDGIGFPDVNRRPELDPLRY